jgi:hypothetical protein
LALTSTPSPAPRYSGSNFTITITVTNGGPGSASNVVLGLLVPAEDDDRYREHAFTAYSRLDQR